MSRIRSIASSTTPRITKRKTARRADSSVQTPLETYLRERGSPNFWDVIVYAWGGHLAEAGRRAAEIDEKAFGPVLLRQITHCCTCGAPWDLEATPNFAARIRDGNIAWPPPSPLTFPLKDW